MVKKKEAPLKARAVRRESKDHIEALEESKKPASYVSFHVRLAKPESRELKKILYNLDITGAEWVRQMIKRSKDQ